MPTVRIRWDWPGESRLGRLAMDLASSVSVPLSAGAASDFAIGSGKSDPSSVVPAEHSQYGRRVSR